MKKSEIKDVQAFCMDNLGKVRNCVTVRRAMRFIAAQPDDANIWFHDTCDYHYSERRNRDPLYDAEIIGAWGQGQNHGKFFWILADKPKGDK